MQVIDVQLRSNLDYAQSKHLTGNSIWYNTLPSSNANLGVVLVQGSYRVGIIYSGGLIGRLLIKNGRLNNYEP